MLKKSLLSSTALMGFAVAPALAADLPLKAAYKAPVPIAFSWTGYYVGLNAGGVWGRSSANTSVDCSSAASPPAYFCNSTGTGAANAAAVAAGGTGPINGSGFTSGLQAGYNWQTNNLVYGLETDFGAFKLTGTRQGSGTYPGGLVARPGSLYAVGSSYNTDWLFTFRGRFGWLLTSNLLAYATGGLALTKLQASNSFTDAIAAPPGASESANDSKLKTGWALGGGLEWALGNQWSIRGEYLYLNFGKVTASGNISNNGLAPGYAQGISTSADLTAQVARIGVNRKF